MFNPITVIHSVWSWFVNTISQWVSFSKQKFLLVIIALGIIGWYYIKCYETPVFQTGYSLQLAEANLLSDPSVNLSFNFDHNNLSEREVTNSLILNDHIVISPSLNTPVDSFWFVLGRKTIDLSQSAYENKKQEFAFDTAYFGLMLNTIFTYKQPFLYKQPCPEVFKSKNYYLTGLKNTKLISDNYKSNDFIATTDVYYANKLEKDDLYVVYKDTFKYSLICKPQWRCAGDLSSFVFKFNDSTYNKDSTARQISKINKLFYEFNDYIQIITMTPMPDSIWATGFAFLAPKTLDVVQNQGIVGFGKFPAMESWQMVRTFALTTLLATLISLLLGLIYNFISNHSQIKSLTSIIITVFIICAAILTVTYEDFPNIQDYFQNAEYFKLILHVLLYLIMCLFAYIYIYYKCKRKSITIWVFLSEIIMVLLFSKAMYTILSIPIYDEQHFDVYNISVFMLFVSIVLPTFTACRSQIRAIHNRYKRMYGKQWRKRGYYTYFFLSFWLLVIPVFIAVLYTPLVADYDDNELTSKIIVDFIIIIELIVMFILFANSKRSGKIKEFRKEVIKGSVLCQPLTIWSSIILLLISFCQLVWMNKVGLSEIIKYPISAFILFTPLWIFPYLYNPSLALRYWEYTKAQRNRFIYRICKLNLKAKYIKPS